MEFVESSIALLLSLVCGLLIEWLLLHGLFKLIARPASKKISGAQVSPLSSLLSLLFVLSLSTSVTAGEVSASPPNHTDDYKISVNVGLVVLPVTVTNGKGAFVPDLRQQDFHVYETGRLQQITSFQPEDVPVTVGLVVDNSGSMGPKRPAVIAASLAFVRSSNSQDQMFVVNFDQSYSNENPDVLKRLSKLTGGQAYFPESISEVFKVSEQISRDLRQQYTISYIPTDRTPDGRYRTIRVTAKASGKGKLYVRTRAGYLIPSETPNTASIAQTGSP